ncbi:peptidylprolyl isomerase, partial [Sulfurovum sp. bin170]|uniref:peptidylprolyl isomerase n=1 Tax=Sulfurovum sp. bin170 TaxID=2695268 RepID=UPI001417DA6D
RYYRENDSKFYQSASASARHILVTTQSEAREIIKELEFSSNLRERFIELAKIRSTGPSGKNGGDLGWFSKDQMVPEFSNATFALNPGNFTHIPVQTHFGYHIIYLTDKKPAGKIEFSKVRDSIANSLKLKKFQEDLKNLSKKLKKSANISVK